MGVAGYIHNNMLNPKAACAEGWAQCMAQHSSERVNKYLADFREEFSEYFKNRPESSW